VKITCSYSNGNACSLVKQKMKKEQRNPQMRRKTEKKLIIRTRFFTDFTYKHLKKEYS